ncbi:MAG: MFS transporter, partial [Desulfobacteraceae bacterium]
FSTAQGIAGLALGRALIGLGGSSCLMAAFKAFTLWFPREQWPRVNGFQLAAGGLGAMAATAPVQAALSVTDWRGIFLLLTVLAALAALAVFWVVPECRRPGGASTARDQLKGVAQVFTSPVFWRVTPLATASQATFMSIQSLWAGPWLRDTAGLDRSGVAAVLMWLAAAMALGYIALGTLTERLSRAGVTPMATSVAGMSGFILVQGVIVAFPGLWNLPLWLLFGFTGTTGVIAYAGLSQSFPVDLAGRVNTALNLVVFVAAFAAQWGHRCSDRPLAGGGERRLCGPGLPGGVRPDDRVPGGGAGLVCRGRRGAENRIGMGAGQRDHGCSARGPTGPGQRPRCVRVGPWRPARP